MLQALKTLFGGGDVAFDLAELAARGAQIVDVRSPEEFSRGHVDGAVNLPLQRLEASLSRLRKDRPVIVCCASGVRSAAGKAALDRAGFPEVVDGGPWTAVARRLAA